MSDDLPHTRDEGQAKAPAQGIDKLAATLVAPDRQPPPSERVQTDAREPSVAAEATQPSADDRAFRVEDPFDYARERDEAQALLFGTPIATHRIGRFTVLRRLGQGAMGTVYAAYDDQLDRKVAVKVLRQRAGSNQQTGSARLLREAQAMARLSHPNIVTVHEAGRYEGRVFVAMEFVRGTSLDQWLRTDEGPRAWPEVVAMFRQAGAGLAAAHEAGIVHRDFKPHNVMVGEDRVARVLDFGLARQIDAEHEPSETPSSSASKLASSSASKLASLAASAAAEQTSTKLTATGAVLGTPAYMAPEQCLGIGVSPLSDQFSFCAALYEGLYDQVPFAGTSVKTLFDNVVAGRVREPPRATAARVPNWVAKIVQRGLAREPGDRYPSMDALLVALARDPTLTRRKWFGALTVAAGLSLGAVGLASVLREAPAEPCSGIAAAFAEVDDPTRFARAQAAFTGSGLGYAADTWERVAPQLRAYADSWVDHSQAVCVAHHDGQLSTAMFERASACLAERRAGLDTLLEVFEAADPSVVERATEATAGLPSTAVCTDPRWLLAAVPMPADPAAAAAVEAERERLAQAMVLHRAGRSTDARARLDAIADAARRLDDSALSAELALANGTLAQDAVEADNADLALSRALTGGLEIGHAAVAAEAVARRLYVRGALQNRLDEALVDADYGGALVERGPDPSPLRWLYLNNIALVRDIRGDDDQALALYARARAQLDPDALSVEAAVTRANQAQLEIERHQFARGLTAQRSALAMAEQVYGPRHPMFANYLYILANMLRESGGLTESSALIDRAVAIAEAAHKDASTNNLALRPYLNLGAELANLRRDHARARSLTERALALSDDPDFFTIGLRHELGTALIGLGEREAGIAEHHAALALATVFYSDSPAEIAWSEQGLSAALLSVGELEAALDFARRALARREATPTTTPVELSWALLSLANANLANANLDAAATTLDRARTTLDPAVPPGSPLLGKIWLEIAKTTAAQGDRAASRSAAQTALDHLTIHGDSDDPDLATAQTLLEFAEHPSPLPN